MHTGRMHLGWMLGAALAGAALAGATPAADAPLRVLADRRVEGPVRAIAAEYARRTQREVALEFLAAAEVASRVAGGKAGADAVVCLGAEADGETPVSRLSGARPVAWQEPSGRPVWSAALGDRADAAAFSRFVGGPTGHGLWAASEPGFRIASGKTRAEAYEWVVEHRAKPTYPLTAMRMLGECGGIRDGVCIDVGCGSGDLDIELARRSNLRILGLDIDPQVRPLFERKVREAGLEDRVRFVLGDAQQMPFPDRHADVIVSRGTLAFIPDLGKCLREVHRVLKPTGVAFLGGRYLYTPQPERMPTDALRRIVREAGIPGAEVIEARGQWVKIVGPEAPAAARGFQGSPEMLAARCVADYAITEGTCLVIAAGDGPAEQALERGLADLTRLAITALYPSGKIAREAAERIRAAGLADRVRCATGTLDALPFPDGTFDLLAGAGPALVGQADKARAMREMYRVLREGGAALVGGMYRNMPASRRVSSAALREAAAQTGIPSIRVEDDMGQWVEVRRGIKDRGCRD